MRKLYFSKFFLLRGVSAAAPPTKATLCLQKAHFSESPWYDDLTMILDGVSSVRIAKGKCRRDLRQPRCTWVYLGDPPHAHKLRLTFNLATLGICLCLADGIPVQPASTTSATARQMPNLLALFHGHLLQARVEGQKVFLLLPHAPYRQPSPVSA